jgi:pyridoxal phosphate enzyme (YggS family)
MNSELQQEITRNISEIHNRIRKAAKLAGRNPDLIELVAVTKKKNALVIKTLFENGVKRIGESYFQEAAFKIDLLRDLKIEWHMIGPIQKGKEKKVAALFSTVHSVDRLEVARNLNKAAELDGRVLPVYLEFNTSGEESKYGWKAWNEKEWDELHSDLDEITGFRGLEILGLMTMAPYNIDPEASRPYFVKLRNLREYLNNKHPGLELDGLSMGMSSDFEVAIEEGATILRIGTALVGKR